MPTFNDFKWLTKDGKHLKMVEMDSKHIQAAHAHACAKEFEYFYKSGFFSDLRDQLEQVAEAKGISLAAPDENHPNSKKAEYFKRSQERLKTKKLPEPVQTASNEVERKLEEVDTSTDIS